MKNPIEKIDWDLLRDQKQTLVNLINESVDQKEQDHLTGLYNLLTSIQDYAVDYMSVEENKVFNLNED
jgi:hypothetical protein